LLTSVVVFTQIPEQQVPLPQGLSSGTTS